MQNELKYTVRSREIIDLVAAMRSTRLTLNAYFQRNKVWRDAHRRDFIDTILRGYPFPQIFLARGEIDLETMQANQAVVDGQQRLTTIRDFVDGNLDVEGKQFKDFPPKVREDFLKYEVAVIDFDLDAGDARLKEVFHRLNRTFYSLSAIEKLASEYSASEFLLVARVLCGEILKNPPSDDDELEGASDEDGDEEENEPNIVTANVFSRDPGIDDETWEWLASHAEGPFSKLIRDSNVFSSFEFDRKVPLMFTLNVMCTCILGYYSRNGNVRKLLDEKAIDFTGREEIISLINSTAEYVFSLALPTGSVWWNKANFFTLIVELARHPEIRINCEEARSRLLRFEENIPNEYALAAREAVGMKKERELRGKHFRHLLGGQGVAVE